MGTSDDACAFARFIQESSNITASYWLTASGQKKRISR
jgi:hypothetical protein